MRTIIRWPAFTTAHRLRGVPSLLTGPGSTCPLRDRDGAVQSLEALVAGLCRLALRHSGPVGLTSAAVSRVHHGRLNGVLFASDASARSIDDLQALIGVGPAEQALRTAAPALCGSLAEAGDGRGEWATFLAETASSALGSMWVLPLQIGAVSLGTLTLSGPGRARPDECVLASVFKVADAITTALLLPATSTVQLHRVDLQDADQVVVHQATGMVAVQLGITLTEAQVVLRAAAYAEGGGLGPLTRDVVERRRRFEPEDPL